MFLQNVKNSCSSCSLDVQMPTPCLSGNIIHSAAPHNGASTHRRAVKSTLAGVSRVWPGGELVFMAAGFSGAEMAHYGVMDSQLLVMAIIGVKFPWMRVAHLARQLQKLPRWRKAVNRKVLDLWVSHHHLCLLRNQRSDFSFWSQTHGFVNSLTVYPSSKDFI